MTPTSIVEPSLALYLHFPWCVRKCPYCDFNSHTLRGEIPENEYIAALIRDLDFELTSPVSRLPSPVSERPLTSIFMGGGTPSLFSGAAIARLLAGVRARLHFVLEIEITLEANPGTVDEAHFAAYRAAGVNRLSIGVQSLDAAMLKALGRIHDPQQAAQAVTVARRAGFDNLNLDLMYALPQQTPQQAMDDLRAAIALEPEHLSWYQLTLEPNTEFAARPPPLPDDEAIWAMHEQGLELLAREGYAQYEVSAHAQPGCRSQHNLNYWRFGDYLGIGAGAHGKRTQAGEIRRRARHKHPRTYLEHAGSAAAVQEDRAVPQAELPFEFLMNALRLNDGFTLAEYRAATGGSDWSAQPAAIEARRLHLLDEDDEGVRASALGRRHLNRLMTLFLE